MTTKAELHELIDRLPDGDLSALAPFLGDPELPSLLETPEGEEPLTLDEIAGILQGKRDAREGRVRRFATVEELIADLHSDSEP